MNDEFQADIDAVSDIGVVSMILDVVCQTTGMGFAAVARVTEDRWIVCQALDKIAFGLVAGSELPVETTICDEIRDSGAAVIIDHVAADGHFRHHATPALYGFESYISMPIVLKDGTFFGTLCAIDPQPAKLNNPATIGMFKLFAGLIALHLDSRTRLEVSEASLLNERQIAVLREQFIAVLGHDLRSPVAAISSGLELLQRTPLSDKAAMLVDRMQTSISRMTGLISNVLDFARGRLGGGLGLSVNANAQLVPVLRHVIDETKLVWPERTIEVRFAVAQPVTCDHGRIGQLLSNLLGNALTHGSKDGPVRVEAWTAPDSFHLSVSNTGVPIPATAKARIFEPFFRAASSPSQQGLGLGLFIASQIAQAHGGALSVTSADQETCFSFRMPVVPTKHAG